MLFYNTAYKGPDPGLMAFMAFQKPYSLCMVNAGGILLQCEWPLDEPDEYEGKVVTSLYTSVSEIETDKRTERSLKFQSLLKQWRDERGARSSITQVANMPAYQKICAMGEPAVPLILAQLKSEGDEPDQWFWALRLIIGANPVRPEDQGNYFKMAQAWLKWADENPQCYAW